jgi:hypothetical protein
MYEIETLIGECLEMEMAYGEQTLENEKIALEPRALYNISLLSGFV